MLLQFEELENLGYCGFAVAFFEDKMELVSTSSMSDSFHPQLIVNEYLHALTILLVRLIVHVLYSQPVCM